LIVGGESLGFKLSEALSLLHIRDSLRSSLESVVEVLSLIFPLLQAVDIQVHDFLMEAGVQSFFTLSWVLTWFSHNLEEFASICRIFDFLIGSHPLMPVYLAVGLITYLREDLLKTPCDFAEVHDYFQNLPTDLDIDRLIELAQQYFDQHSPKKLLLGKTVEEKLPKEYVFSSPNRCV
jgi:TBC1 domain family member 20